MMAFERKEREEKKRRERGVATGSRRARRKVSRGKEK